MKITHYEGGYSEKLGGGSVRLQPEGWAGDAFEVISVADFTVFQEAVDIINRTLPHTIELVDGNTESAGDDDGDNGNGNEEQTVTEAIQDSVDTLIDNAEDNA